MFTARPCARVLLEATTESEWVAQTIEHLGHEVIVADPNYAPMYPSRRRRVKTDRRDALMLAEACRLRAYRPAHRVSADQRQVRRLLLARDLLVRSEGLRVRAGNADHFDTYLDALDLWLHKFAIDSQGNFYTGEVHMQRRLQKFVPQARTAAN